MIIFKLNEVLSAKGMTQADLVCKSGLHKSTISNYYNNKFTLISLNLLDMLCETLNCEVEDLLEYISDN